MQTIFAATACLPEGWAQNIRLTLNNGAIERIDLGATPQPSDTRVDVLLPALANLHSHSFQRAMAGRTEYRAAGRDNFWTWRELMYRFLDHLTPEQIEAIAALTFMEMLEAGYAAVGEFHYVHHQIGGTPYAQIDELSQRIFAAAAQSGIGLTHLPVLYTYGGAQQKPLVGGQQRFGNDLERFAELLDAARTSARVLPDDTRVGIAPHSLRATTPEDLARVLPLAEQNPIHMHISEQPLEVSEVEAWLGARPVEWLLDNAPVGSDWCLIHATHMTEDETHALAQSGAVVGLCPITESNLGDGPFNGPTYLAEGGTFGIGSDSNVRISLVEELRTMEYSQRLRDLARNVMVQEDGSVGRSLYLRAAKGSAQAMGRAAGEITTGNLADLVAISRTHPALYGLGEAQLLDGLCFAADDRSVTDVWAAGRHMVRDGRHIARDAILTRYRSALDALVASL